MWALSPHLHGENASSSYLQAKLLLTTVAWEDGECLGGKKKAQSKADCCDNLDKNKKGLKDAIAICQPHWFSCETPPPSPISCGQHIQGWELMGLGSPAVSQGPHVLVLFCTLTVLMLKVGQRGGCIQAHYCVCSPIRMTLSLQGWSCQWKNHLPPQYKHVSFTSNVALMKTTGD